MGALLQDPTVSEWQHTTHTRRLRLRTLRTEDLEAVHGFLLNPEIAAPLDFPAATTIESFSVMVGTGACGQLYGLWELESTAFVGLAGLHRQGRKPGWCRLLYALVPGMRGRGFAAEAAMKLLEVAFRWTEAEGVTAAIHTDNASSRSVALRLGMTRLAGFEPPGLEIYGLSREAWDRARGDEPGSYSNGREGSPVRVMA